MLYICAYDMSKSISYSILYVILQTMEDAFSAQSLRDPHFHYQIMMNYRIIVNKCAILIHYAQHILLEGRLYYMHMNTSELLFSLYAIRSYILLLFTFASSSSAR